MMSDPLTAAKVYSAHWKKKAREAEQHIAELEDNYNTLLDAVEKATDRAIAAEAERDRLREAAQQAIDLLGQLWPSNHNKIKARRLLAVALAGQEEGE